MNNLKTTPVGTDLAIARIQKTLYDNLILLWGGELEGYPRCYIVRREKLITIEYYQGEKEYGNLVNTDKNKFFFVAESDKSTDNQVHFSQAVQLYFILDLKQCYPNISHRADEEVRQDVLDILSKHSDCQIRNSTVGLQNVFRSVSYKETFDTHPKHCFRIDLILNNLRTFKTC
jgi:hypothetical protein